jgi:hypothetical protein
MNALSSVLSSTAKSAAKTKTAMIIITPTGKRRGCYEVRLSARDHANEPSARPGAALLAGAKIEQSQALSSGFVSHQVPMAPGG